MALKTKPQSFVSYAWDGPSSGNKEYVITVTLAEKDPAEPTNKFYKLVFNSKTTLMRESLPMRNLFALDVKASDPKIVEYFYIQAERYCSSEIPFLTRIADRTALWVRKHVDFVIEPGDHDFQRFPNKQLILGGSLFVHFVIDSKRFIDMDGSFPEAGVFTSESLMVISIADNRAPLVLSAS